jgi:hypothetical protein
VLWPAARPRLWNARLVLPIAVFPYLLDLILRRPERVGPTLVIDNVLYTVAHPETLRVRDAFHAFASACEYNLLTPATFAWFGAAVLVSVAIAAFRWRRDVLLLFATVIPILAAIAGFSFWQRPYDYYWRPAASAAALVLLLGVIAALPSRIAAARTMNRLPEYAALVRASREIRRYTPEIREIVTEFPLPPTADTEFLYEVLGGRVTPDSGFRAIVSRSGDVTYKAAAP